MEAFNSKFSKKSINILVDEFYKFMGETYIDYNKNTTDIKGVQDTNVLTSVIVVDTIAVDTIAVDTISMDTISMDTIAMEIDNITKPKPKSFVEHFLFKLFYNYGIKRRMVNEHIALLYYAKNLKGYKQNEAITIICRHMLLDTRNMRIVSIGIPKAFNLDTFCNMYDIDKTKSETNFIKDQNDLQNNISKFQINNFPEGTMITYNPSLTKYSITTITTINDNDNINIDIDNDIESDIMNIDNSTKELLDNNIEIKFNQQFLYSTRKVIGTGCFNSLKTFSELFEDNNKIMNTNLQNIPTDLLNDTVLVFNIEHPDNRVISSNIKNCNTLCAVFKFKNETISQEQFDKILSVKITIDNEDIIKNYFKDLGNDMVTQIQLDIFNTQIEQYNTNIHFPEVINSIKDLDSGLDLGLGLDLIYNITFEKLEEIVNNKPKDFQGYIIYGINGERTKIINKNYKELTVLKGNKPITIDKWNIKNLFYLYWRLVKHNKIDMFIKEFEITNDTNTNTNYTYVNTFTWFLNLVKIYALNLFKVYHNSFVKKMFAKHLIPFTMKPMCGDLHKLYLSNKVPITPLIVNNYIFEQPSSKLFWRIFLDNKL